MKTIEDFKLFCRGQVDRHYYITAPIIVLISFYYIDIQKPPDITIRQFDWLLSIARQEIQIYKQNIKP